METDSNKKNSSLRDINFSLWAELLFVFLPFFITIIAFAFKNELVKLFFAPEWSMAAAILSGQTIVKFISGLIKFGKTVNLGIIALTISTMIVFLLAPSLVVLTLIITGPETPETWLVILQIIFFSLSVFLFLFLGNVSEKILFATPTVSKS